MNVSLNWLGALLGKQLAADDAAHRLSMAGAGVEAVEPLHRELDDVVIALVEAVDKHPNADRLSLCRVNDGRGVVEVVCGAPNVTAGRKYPFAPVGSVLPGGLKLTARTIRGVTSHGMLCSARELGLGSDHEGILELRTDAEPGTKLTDALELQDTRLTLEITANRPDLLCHKGVARELAPVYGVPVKLPKFPKAPKDGDKPRRVKAKGTVGGIEVSIEDVDGCPRYIAAVIRGVTVGPSPAWLEARLRSIGARPINNVVDATNYVLFELNQPMHAFDLAKLRGSAIIVRRAKPGEKLVTLDGEARDLEPSMTLICDAEGPTAVAGVMGGVDSEVSGETTDVLLECAYFDPKRIRATRKALKMSTEASYRFERGIDQQGMPDAVRRAVSLLRAVAGGTEPEPAIDVYPKPAKPRAVFLRPERVAHLLGMTVETGEIEGLLVSVGFVVAPKGGRLHVQVPGWRPDVTREVDLIEEVARLKGYDAFPVELRAFRPSAVPDDPVEVVKARTRRVLTAHGLNEARTLPLVPESGDGAQPLQNPLSAEEAYLRRDLLPGLARSAARNWASRERDIRLFEIGAVFEQVGPGKPPRETLRVAGLVSGARVPPHWTAAGKAPDYDEWDLKAMFEHAARVAGPPGRVMACDGGWELLDASDTRRGWARAIHADRPAWAAPLWGFELDLEVHATVRTLHRPLPTTPPVERDVALVIPAGVTAAQVEAVMRERGGPFLESATVFDEYRGREVAGRGVAWHLVFRAPDRTLTDADADRALNQMLDALTKQLNVRRRT